MKKDKILIDDKEYVTIKAYLLLEACPWTHRQTLQGKIYTESFPAIKRGNQWWICLKDAELWHKRRDTKASA